MMGSIEETSGRDMMTDLVEVLEGRYREVADYLKAADAERVDLIQRTDNLGSKLRKAEDDLTRLERALAALKDQRAESREAATTLTQVDMPYLPRR